MERAIAIAYNVESYEEYLRVLEVISNPKYYGADEYKPELLAPLPVELPEIVFDSRGWSQELLAANGDYFHMYRLPSGARYVLKNKNSRTISQVLSFGGALALASTMIRGPIGLQTPLSSETVTDDDRKTNYGAF